ncbi:hypothetical protein LYSBPC_13450 [Lysinibacillus piscis]|uniref:Uncharacterized protein n=1 Tax=Lysinibacillus piscis TaxID=2518931 RepID=A0ABQ5NJD0_9BACI|nr:hypothetical protein LYSBPC_13450 [Lysinibacillus sp. KH24]
MVKFELGNNDSNCFEGRDFAYCISGLYAFLSRIINKKTRIAIVVGK